MVDVTPITPITPGTTSVAQAVASANDAFERVVQSAEAINGLLIDTGDKANLQTDAKDNFVNAINEILTRFNNGFLIEGVTGSLVDLQTISKTDLVASINELVSKIGSTTSLNTTNKNSIVEAINEIIGANSSIGSLANLTTIDKASIVAAINELASGLGNFGNLDGHSDVVSAVEDVSNRIGDNNGLNTLAKTSLVEALNEILTQFQEVIKRDGSVTWTGHANLGGHRLTNVANGSDNNDAVTIGQIEEIVKVGDVSMLMTAQKDTAVSAINEIYANTGSLNLLTTTDKASVVSAINEVVANLNYQDMQTKLSELTTVGLGTGVLDNHDQHLDYRASATSVDYDARISRLQGSNGNLRLLNKGSGKITFATQDDINGVVERVRINNDPSAPIEVLVNGTWTEIQTGGASLPLAGGVMTGPIVFGLPLDQNNILFDLQNEYSVYVDNSGSYTGSSNNRVWFGSPIGGEIHFGPRTEGENAKAVRFRTERMDITGELFAETDITLLSDIRVKSEIKLIQDALEVVSGMRGYHYVKDGKFSTGFIAQYVEEVAPELVKTDETTGLKRVNYVQTTAYLAEAIVELHDKFKDLEYRISLLEGK